MRKTRILYVATILGIISVFSFTFADRFEDLHKQLTSSQPKIISVGNIITQKIKTHPKKNLIIKILEKILKKEWARTNISYKFTSNTQAKKSLRKKMEKLEYFHLLMKKIKKENNQFNSNSIQTISTDDEKHPHGCNSLETITQKEKCILKIPTKDNYDILVAPWYTEKALGGGEAYQYCKNLKVGGLDREIIGANWETEKEYPMKWDLIYKNRDKIYNFTAIQSEKPSHYRVGHWENTDQNCYLDHGNCGRVDPEKNNQKISTRCVTKIVSNNNSKSEKPKAIIGQTKNTTEKTKQLKKSKNTEIYTEQEKQAMIRDITTVDKIIEPFLLHGTIDDIKPYIQQIKNLETIEDAYISGHTFYIKIVNGGFLSWSWTHSEGQSMWGL